MVSNLASLIVVASLAIPALSQNIGSWEILAENKVVCIHTILLPGNKIMCMERPHVKPYVQNPRSGGEVVSIIDLNTDIVTLVPTTRNPFCAGHAQRADGSILIIGGDEPGSVTSAGTQITDSLLAQRIFHPCDPHDKTCVTGRYELLPDMSTKRWYPTVITLASGDGMIVSGSTMNLDFEKLDGANNPTYEYFPARTAQPKVLDSLKTTFPYNLYPTVFQLAHGPVMVFTATMTDLIDAVTDTVLPVKIPDIDLVNKEPWIYPYTPTSVMMPLTKANGYTSRIMICGGTRKEADKPADDRCIGINFGDAAPEWKELVQDPMPDGTVLFVNGAGAGMAGGDGGDSRNAWDPVYKVHLYTPTAAPGKKWSTMASASVPRLYHSGAILIPDGRVVTTGSEEQNFPDMHRHPEKPLQDCFPINREKACTDPFEYRMEVFNPPYLSLPVERVVVHQAPLSITYTSKFSIVTSTDATKVDKAVFIRYSTSTHSTNFDQRYVEANIISVNATYLLIEAPKNGHIAPPGNYHLFLMRGGKPSVGVTILLQEGGYSESDAPLNPQEPALEQVKSMSSRSSVGLVLSAMIAIVLLCF